MGLTLKDLEEVVAPIAKFSQQEISFDIGALAITLRSLTPEEEMDVLRFARAVVAEGESVDQATAVDYSDRVMTRCLSYSIVVLGSMDLRGVDSLETGDKLPNGVAVRVPKTDALMGILRKWARPMRVGVFKKFHELIDKMESDVMGLIQFETKDLDVEIARLEEKLAELRERKVQAEMLKQDPRDRMLNADEIISPLRQVGRTAEPETDVDSAEAEEETPPVPVVAVPTERGAVRSIAPEPQEAPAAPAPRRSRFGSAPPPRAAVAPQPVPPAPAPIEPPSAEDSFDAMESSFADPSDANAINAMNQRLLADRARRHQMAERNLRNMDELNVQTAARAPHLLAREAFQEIQGGDGNQVGTLNGVAVFKMPSQTLTDRGAGPSQDPRPAVPAGTNPKFRPAK